MSAYVHIHAPSADMVRLHRRDCPTCERRRYFVAAHYEWYGWDLTCLWCGDTWQDGYRRERPFARGWREKSKASARALYRRYRAAASQTTGDAP